MRVVTRGDLDGLTCAVLLSEMELVDSIELIHPQDITDNRFEPTENDILANLPYHPRCAMWFDHHLMTDSNRRPPEGFRGRHDFAPSAARVIYDHYASDLLNKFEYLVQETDRLDSAQLSIEEVTHPTGVILLGFTIDGRTGIGDFKDYFLKLVEWLRRLPVEEVLRKQEVVDRVDLMKKNNDAFIKSVMKHSRLDGNVVITDFRTADRVPIGNRFLVYTLFPEANVSLRLQWGPGRSSVIATIGHNIFYRTSKANCGEICGRFGGGGHKGAGAVPLAGDRADEQIAEIIRLLKEAG